MNTISRKIIARGAKQLDKLLDMTLQAMAATEDDINNELEAL